MVSEIEDDPEFTSYVCKLCNVKISVLTKATKYTPYHCNKEMILKQEAIK